MPVSVSLLDGCVKVVSGFLAPLPFSVNELLVFLIVLLDVFVFFTQEIRVSTIHSHDSICNYFDSIA